MYMETTNRTVQTAFRFRPELLSRIKAKARLEGKSVNSFVESTIEDYLAKDADRYEKLFHQIESMQYSQTNRLNLPELKGEIVFSDEQLNDDPRLEYLVDKHLR